MHLYVFLMNPYFYLFFFIVGLGIFEFCGKLCYNLEQQGKINSWQHELSKWISAYGLSMSLISLMTLHNKINPINHSKKQNVKKKLYTITKQVISELKKLWRYMKKNGKNKV